MSKFWWLPWFSAQNTLCHLICTPLYYIRLLRSGVLLELQVLFEGGLMLHWKYGTQRKLLNFENWVNGELSNIFPLTQFLNSKNWLIIFLFSYTLFENSTTCIARALGAWIQAGWHLRATEVSRGGFHLHILFGILFHLPNTFSEILLPLSFMVDRYSGVCKWGFWNEHLCWC